MLETKTDTKIQSNLGGTTIAMGIDENSLSKLMRMLSGLYSDNELAIIREYSTNALDSHVEAGVSDPIKVTLPTQLSPFLTVQDFGIGMDLETIKNVYSKYGASTKTDTNTQVGMLGVGCKSALAYTDQFTLVGIKNGMRYRVIISRDEYGSGSMTVMGPEPTTERNGVTVQIPIKRMNSIATKCANFFSYWRPGTVLINDEEPNYIEGDYITKKIVVVEGVGKDVLVMGGVPYPVVFNHGLANDAGLVYFADIGDVDFVPSREALDYSTKTKECIAAVNEKFITSITRAVQKDIDSQTTFQAALLTSLKWRRKLGRSKAAEATLKYKGNDIPLRYDAEIITDDQGEIIGKNRFIVSQSNTTKVSAHSKEDSIAASWMTDALIVYGYELTFTAPHKRKMELFAQGTVGFRPRYFIMCKNKPKGIEWLDPSRIVHYDVIKAIKLPQYTKARADRVKGSYEVQQGWTTLNNVEASDLALLPKLYYMTNGVDIPKSKETQFFALVNKLVPDAPVVRLPSNRTAKFTRDFPRAVPISKVLANLYGEQVAQIPKEVFEAQKIRANFAFPSNVKFLKEIIDKYGAFTDPEIMRLINAYDIDIRTADSLNDFTNIRMWLPKTEDLPIIKWSNPFNDYPLWSWKDLRYNYEHAKLYADAAYSKIVKKKRVERNRKVKTK